MWRSGCSSRARRNDLPRLRRTGTARAARRRGCWRGRRSRDRYPAVPGCSGADEPSATERRATIRSRQRQTPGIIHRDAESAATVDDPFAFFERDAPVRADVARPSRTVPFGQVISMRGHLAGFAQAERQRQLALRAVARSGLHHAPELPAVVQRDRDPRADAVAIGGGADACAHAATGSGCRRRCAAAAPGRCWW